MVNTTQAADLPVRGSGREETKFQFLRIAALKREGESVKIIVGNTNFHS